MKIIAQAKINGSEVNGVILEDNGEQTPVYFNVLRNKVYAEPLKEAGYSLYSLDRSIFSIPNSTDYTDTLPIREVELTTMEEQDNLDLQSGPLYMSMEELSEFWEIGKQQQKTAGFKVEPQYKIFDRDELIQYLKSEAGKRDFRPINFYAAPEALVPLSQLNTVVGYCDAIESKQTIQYADYLRLIKWLQSIGMLGETFTYFDVLEAYTHWGINGIRMNIYSRSVKDNIYIRSGSASGERVSTMFLGAINREGELLTSDYANTWNQKFISALAGGKSYDPKKPDKSLSKTMMELEDNEYTPVTLIGERVIKRGSIYTDQGEFYFDECQNVYMSAGGALRILPTLKVTYGSIYTPPVYRLGSEGLSMLKDDIFCYALANEIKEKAYVQDRTSSYDLLTDEGMSPLDALRAITNYCDNTFATEDGRNIVIGTNDVNNYLHIDEDIDGASVSKEVVEWLDDFVSGASNIGAIGACERSSSKWGALASKFIIAHEILGVPLNDIYNAVKNEENGDPATWRTTNHDIVLQADDGAKVICHVTPDTVLHDTVESTRAQYFESHFKNNVALMWIDAVLTEFAAEPRENPKHVACRGRYLSTEDPTVKQGLDFVREKYLETIDTTFPDRESKKKLRAVQYFNTVKYLFRLMAPSSNGVLTFDHEIGGCSYPAPEGLCDALRACIRPFDLTTVTISSFMFGGWKTVGFDKELQWGFCPVNAVVTIDRVYPLFGTINEVNFGTHYYPQRQVKPEVWNKIYPACFEKLTNRPDLINHGKETVFGAQYGEYKSAYYDPEPYKTDIYYAENDHYSITSYERCSNEWRNEVLAEGKNVKIKHAPHPASYLYNRVYKDDVPCSVEVEGADFSNDKQGWKRDLICKDSGIYVRKIDSSTYPQKKRTRIKENTQYKLERFYTFTPAELYMTNFKCLYRDYPIVAANIVSNGHVYKADGTEVDLSTVNGDMPEAGIYEITKNSYLVVSPAHGTWRFEK